MKAHERISDSIAKMTETDSEPKEFIKSFGQQKSQQTRLYKSFLSEVEGAAELPAKERHDRFREWQAETTSDS